MTKIAVVTDDGKSISMHFGRAAHYLVFTVEDGTITGTELRDKMGHRQFVNMEPAPGNAHNDEAGHEHDHGDHDHGGHNDPRGHGFGAHADRKHSMMIEAIKDCDAVLVRGMGRGAYLAMQSADITPIVTDIASAENAVKAHIDGTIVDHTDKLH